MVSSSHIDPMDQFSKLTQQQNLQQHQQPAKLPRWFCPNVLRYYVLVHDVMQEQQNKYVPQFDLYIFQWSFFCRCLPSTHECLRQWQATDQSATGRMYESIEFSNGFRNHKHQINPQKSLKALKA